MTFLYKRATIKDLDLLTETRIEVLRAANQLSECGYDGGKRAVLQIL